MGWFFGKRRLKPDELRDALFEAIANGDGSRFAELVDKEKDAIREHFSSWQKVPDAVRRNPPEMQRYAGALIATAQHFRSELGDGSLLERLMGPSSSDPISKWEDALHGAKASIAAFRYAEAEAALRERVDAARGLSGTAVERYLPITLGLLGQCRFHTGMAGEAVPLFRQALELCEQTGDLEGLIAYHDSLYEAQRFLGDSNEAVRHAHALAACCERAGDTERAASARKRARRVHDGEPLVRVVLEMAGKTLELEELGGIPTGNVRFIFERNRISLGAVTALVEKGEQFGNAGDDARALEAFRAAARIDATDPRPPYLAGLAEVGLRRYAAAVESYDLTERLAPGWYHCRADRALASALASGRIAHVTFDAVRAIEDGGRPAKERVLLADRVLVASPELPILHLLKADALIELGADDLAAEAARAGLAQSPDPDVHTRLLVALARVKRPPESRRLLEEAIALDGNRVAAATARVMLLGHPSN